MITESGKNSENRNAAALLIVSDRAAKGVRPDATGPALKIRLEEAGFLVRSFRVVPDDPEIIVAALRGWVFDDRINLILTSGGTGLGPRDVTPEATLTVIERRVPGLEEAMRRVSFEITPNAMLSRAVAGTAGTSLIINLPGSPKGALENLEVVLPALGHAIELLLGRAPDP